MLGFCEKCRDMVEYSIREVKMTKTIKGKEIEYVGKLAFCNECKSEIFVAEIRDNNLMMLDEVFRKKEELITVSEIKFILEKYDIGKRPLSLLLGWGEVTLTRYLDGDIPSKQYSDTLKKILDDSEYMIELLEKNKENITEVAYKRCKASLLKVETNDIIKVSSQNKIDHIVKYLLLSCSDITPLALQKLLYYAQGFYRVFTGEYLFDNDCEAWVHGPVYSSVYHKYKNYGCTPIEKDNEYDNIELSTVEKDILDSVIRNFGCYSGKVLEDMTHAELPWSQTRIGLRCKENSNRIIEKGLIVKYFNDIKLKHNMLNTCDIKDYSIDLFNKLYN
jgi:putative zinc finger/helix-turn-helix YgiT family protein